MRLRRRIRGVTKLPEEGTPELPHQVLVNTPKARGPIEGYYIVWRQAFNEVCRMHHGRWVTNSVWCDRDGIRHEMICDSDSNIMAYCAVPKGGLDFENGKYSIRAEVWESITSLDL